MIKFFKVMFLHSNDMHSVYSNLLKSYIHTQTHTNLTAIRFLYFMAELLQPNR